MRDKELKEYLHQSFRQEIEPKRIEETVKSCITIVREFSVSHEEKRTGFWRYLSDVFRFEGFLIFGLQVLTLLIVCLGISTIADVPKYIPVFMPLFALALIPALFKSQTYGMCEIEAVTRASGAQIILAKLILIGASNLVCMTVLFCLELYLQNSVESIGQIILYSLVPYLVCMVLMLRCTRLCKKESITKSMIITLGSCTLWGISAKVLPWLYETSAMGIWIIMFLFFTLFFIKEIYFIMEMRKEGRIYGTIS